MSQLEQYSSLNHLTDCVLIIDQDHKIVFANQHFLNLYAGIATTIIGAKCHEILHRFPCPCAGQGVPEQDCVHRQVFTTGLAANASHCHTTPAGAKIFSQITASPMRDKDGKISRMISVIKDITKEKELQETLNTTVIEHEAILQNVPYYLSYVDQEMRVIKLNAFMEQLIGCNTAEVKGRHCYEIWGQHAGNADKKGREKICEPCKIQYSLADGRHYRYERQLKGRYVEVTASPVKDKEGHIIGALECGIDITDRKRTELALQKSEIRYAALFHKNPNIMVLTDLETATFIDANPAACQFYGYTKEEWPGMKIAVINVLSQGRLRLKMREVEIKGKEVFYYQHRLKSGEMRDVEIHSGTLIIDDRQVICSTIIDITERLLAEKAVAKSRDEWENTFDALTDIITIQNRDMRIIRANKAAHQFFQVPMGGLNGRRCYELFRNISTPCPDCPLVKTIAGQGNHSCMINHENLGKFFQVSSSVMADKKGEINNIVHIARDITAQKKMEENLLQGQKLEAIGTMAGGIAHDFNNILSAILGYSELAQIHLSAGTSAQEDIEQIIVAGQRATNLVKQILDFSRKTEQQLLPLQPHLIIEEVLRLLGATLPSTVTIKKDIDPDCGLIMADATKMHQVVMNLCTNGFHALQNEKGTLTVALTHQERTGQNPDKENRPPVRYIVLSVSDTGQGMAAATATRIFEPYFTTRERGSGTGLGLAVVHGIIKGYNGFIEVESEPGHGCTCRVFIPALTEDSKATNMPKPIKQQNKLPFGNEHILVIDDEPLLVRINQRLLENYGYTVTGFTDSRQALTTVEADPRQFDLIITDQTMPGISGSELIQAVLQVAPTMPIIICTGHSAIMSAEEALAMGVRRFLNKPLEKDILARTVRLVLDEQKKTLIPAG